MSRFCQWLILVASLPGQNASARMRVWRALKASGAVMLRDGVYLLPRNIQAEAVFTEQAKEVSEAGGTAYVGQYIPTDVADHEGIRRLFDRTEEYEELFVKFESFKQSLTSLPESDARRQLTSLRREYMSILETDFFPGPSREQLEQTVTDAESAFNLHFYPGEPHAATGAIKRLDKAEYQTKVWVTRERLWVDRVASAWLIRRFIDPTCKFLWLKDVSKRPKRTVGFDFDGAEFTHLGNRVTFEVLATSFGLDRDPAVAKIGAMVHYLDVGGVPISEAAGFIAIMSGARAELSNDDELLVHIGKVLDLLYHGYGYEMNPR